MILKNLIEFLDRERVKYVVISHSPAFTAHEVAATAHIPAERVAKTVMVKVDGKMAMAVVPASHMIDFRHLRDAIGAKRVELATEAEFQNLFAVCELGAMPPFGNLYNMDVYVSEWLREDVEIAFNAGSHRELVKMSYADFDRLVAPKVLQFSVKKKVHGEDEKPEPAY